MVLMKIEFLFLSISSNIYVQFHVQYNVIICSQKKTKKKKNFHRSTKQFDFEFKTCLRLVSTLYYPYIMLLTYTRDTAFTDSMKEKQNCYAIFDTLRLCNLHFLVWFTLSCSCCEWKCSFRWEKNKINIVNVVLFLFQFLIGRHRALLSCCFCCWFHLQLWAFVMNTELAERNEKYKKKVSTPFKYLRFFSYVWSKCNKANTCR